MKIRRRHQTDEDALDVARHPRVDRHRTEQTPRDAILALQERAGNRSVAELLAGYGPAALRAAVQREAGEDIGTSNDATPEESATSASTLTIPDLAAVIQVTSFSLGVRASGGKKSSVERPRPTLTIPIEGIDPRLVQAAATGRQFRTMVITYAGGTITLGEVVVANCRLSSTSATVTLDAETMERAGE